MTEKAACPTYPYEMYLCPTFFRLAEPAAEKSGIAILDNRRSWLNDGNVDLEHCAMRLQSTKSVMESTLEVVRRIGAFVPPNVYQLRQ